MIVLLNSCAVEKNNYQILKNSKADTLNKKTSYGTIMNTGRMKKIDRDGYLFDQFIADDFHLPKNKQDSAAIVDYFVETSYAQLGRREFKHLDLVVVRDVLFQINVPKKSEPEPPVFANKIKIELISMIFLLFGFSLL